MLRKILRRYGIAVTSLGLTCLSILLLADVDALLSQVDQALYQAKRNGCNQVAFYRPSSAALPTAGYLEIDASPVKAKLDDVELQRSTGNPGQ